MSAHDLGYEIDICWGALKSIEKHILPYIANRKIHIVTDENVNGIYRDLLANQLVNYTVSWSVIPSGESYKTMETVLHVVEDLVASKIQRSDILIAFGGGVVGDLAGFVASMYLRGIDYLQVPTTLLSQVDSSVGSKVGVDFAGGKNLIGSFYRTKKVIIDPEVLETLDDRQFNSGMAEVIKYGCIYDEDLFSLCEYNAGRSKIQDVLAQVIERCCEIKKELVLIDFYDRKERLYLNFGHTLGHALESLTNYRQYTHGEAVSIGMNVIMDIGVNQGFTNRLDAQRLKNICESYELPVHYTDDLSRCIPLLSKDKKNLNHVLNVVVCPSIGTCRIDQYSLEKFEELIYDYCRTQ